MRRFERALIGSCSRGGIVFFRRGKRGFFQRIARPFDFYFIVENFDFAFIETHQTTVAAPEKSAAIAEKNRVELIARFINSGIEFVTIIFRKRVFIGVKNNAAVPQFVCQKTDFLHILFLLPKIQR